MTGLYENLLKATNNIDDITTEKYATVTKLNGNYCDAKEEDTGLEHTNVPIINGANLSVGDKAIIGFLNNSIYDVVCYGALDKTIHDDSKQDTLISGENIKTINHTSLLGSGNIDIQGGGSDVDIVTSWEPTPSDTKVPSEKLTKNTLDNKVDTVTGKGLSTNDFTNSYKNTIDGLSTVATTGDYDDLSNKPSIPSSSSDLSDGSDLVKKSSTSGLIKNDGTIDTTSYSTFSGSYNDLTNRPTIPSASTTTPSADTSSGSYGSGTNYARSNHTHPKSSLYAEATHSHTKSQITDFPTIPSKTSDLTNDSGFITSSSLPTKTSDLTNDGDGTNPFLTQHQSLVNYVQKSSISGLLKNDGSVDTTQYLSSLPSHNHDDRYYTESEMDDALDDKQDLLISGTNIKTINNTSLLGSGNITIGGGGSSVDIATSWGNPTSDSKVPSEKLTKTSLDDKISKSSTSGLVKNDGSIDTTNYVNTNDSRLSDARTPLSHTHTSSQVTDLIDVIYPVGSIYMSVNSTSPQTLFGGTWEQIKDTFLLASGDTYANGTTGGSADAVVVSHNHSTDRAYVLTTDGSGVSRISTAGQTGTKVSNLLQSADAIYRNQVNSAGESGTGKNMPPYLTVFVWKRTA